MINMQQTPVHEQHNPDLLRLIPTNATKIIEVGCSSGALAREFKIQSPLCDYLGIEIDPTYAALAERHCNSCLTLDIESASDAFWTNCSDRDCWIFGDTLEHLRDPWTILRRIHVNLPKTGSIVACIPNFQHWSIQAKLSFGDFRYQQSGLLDKTHLRWFTRQTIFELFDETGFKVQDGMPRIFNENGRDAFLPIIAQMAMIAGADPEQAIEDALPLQYVVRAIPK
jgi:trans-aconitate methyltransferase